jgi:hypothetical protein
MEKDAIRAGFQMVHMEAGFPAEQEAVTQKKERDTGGKTCLKEVGVDRALLLDRVIIVAGKELPETAEGEI